METITNRIHSISEAVERGRAAHEAQARRTGSKSDPVTIAYLDTLAPQVRRGEIVARIAELDAMHQRTSTEQSWAELTALQSELKDLDKPATVPTKRDFEGAAAAEFDDPHGIRWGTHSREDYVMIRARELAQE